MNDDSLDIVFNHKDTQNPVSVCSDLEGMEICGLPFLSVLESVRSHCEKHNPRGWEMVLDEVPLHKIKDYLEVCDE